MLKEIKMPSAGQTTDEATIISVNVKKGDSVKRGDVLVEAETDKATLPVESFAEGIVLKINIKEGDTVDAGTVLMVIGDESDQIVSKQTALDASQAGDSLSLKGLPEEDEEEYQPIDKSTSSSVKRQIESEISSGSADVPVAMHAVAKGSIKAMPNAKKLAKETGVNLNEVALASGGLIKLSDVERHISQSSIASSCSKAAEIDDEYIVQPQSRMRRTIATRMIQSCIEIPSFQITVKIDMTAVIDLKSKVMDLMGLKLSYNDIMCKALALTAKEFPLLNARYENDEIRIFNHTNIGIAVGLENGLVVPVVRHVDELSLSQIASVNKSNIDKARKGQLLPSDMGTGSVSLSNLGMFDVDLFSAIVNPPESCIFAIGRIANEPVSIEGAFVPRPLCSVTVSFDHRMIDGSYGAKLLKKFKSLMENPVLLLL